MTSGAAPGTGLVIGTAGHVDHGKTSLVKALTGVDTDRLREEKRRGLTIDLGFAPLRFDDGLAASIVDVPGHERFIRNMLAGATGMDLALLVVAVDDGVMPQTVEHAEILNLLGVSRCVAVLTKCDLVDRSRIDEVRGAVKVLLKGTILEGAPFAEVSAATGEGVMELKALIRRGLASSSTDGQSAGLGRRRGRFRLPVDRSFAVPGFGTVVTGSVAGGHAAKGDELIRLPGGERVRVRGIESLNAQVEAVGAGRRAALNIAGLAHTEITRGDVLADRALSMAAGTRRVDCLFEFIGKGRVKAGAALKGRGPFRVHHLTDEADAAVRLAGKRAIEPGVRAFGRLFLKKPLLMLRGDRFILRSPSANATVGGGVVLIPYLSESAAPPLESAPEGFEVPEAARLDDRRLLDYLFSQGNLAVERTRLCLMLDMDEARFAPPKGYVAQGGFIVDSRRLEAVKNAMAAEAARFAAKDPLDGWMGEAALFKVFAPIFRRSIGEAAGLDLFGAVLDKMAAPGGPIERRGALLRATAAGGAVLDKMAAPGRTVAVPEGADEKIKRAVEAVAALFDRAGFAPPDMAELARLPYAGADFDAAFAWLVRSGALVKLKRGRFVAASCVEKAREVLLRMAEERGVIRAAEFRDALGCGRRAAIEMLEYFDAARLTLRRGDERVLRGR